jgi:hypothetical protein
LASHGAGHEQLLEGGNPRLHTAIFVEQPVVPFLQMPDVLGRFTQNLE